MEYNHFNSQSEFEKKLEELTRENERRRLEKLRQKYTTPPDYSNMSLQDELQTRFDLDEMNNLAKKFGEEAQSVAGANAENIPPASYGIATSKELEKYLDSYKMPIGRTRTGLIAPFHDLKRSYQTMKNLGLKESDTFFHCMGNYEAASRGLLNTAIAAELDFLKEIKDVVINGYPLEDSLRDMRSNVRGMVGQYMGKTLQETCPTHHTEYK